MWSFPIILRLDLRNSLVGLRPSFSAQVRLGDPDFLYVAPSYDCVCGFQ